MHTAEAVPGAVVRRLTWLLFFSQSLSSAAFIATGTIAAIVGAELSGQAALAGLPSAVQLLGTALAAYPAARLMERWGRRRGLVLGFGLGIGGGLAAGYAILAGHFAGFLIGYAVMGATRGFSDLGRYAAAEMHPVQERGRAISLVVLGGTVGAIAGPGLVGPAGELATRLQMAALAGPWFVSAALFSLGLLLIGGLLRPDPLDLARLVGDEAEPAGGAGLAMRPLRLVLAQPETRCAVAAMVLGQLVMVMVMSITAVHMTDHGHGLGEVSAVMMAHTLGMFGLSVLTGRWSDRYGRLPLIAAGTVLLMLACVLAPLSWRTGSLAVALFLLGLGWNFCYVAGAALLTDSLNLSERGRLQGSNDLATNLVSAVGSLQSGALFAAIGFGWLNWISLAIALLPLGLAAQLMLAQRQPKPSLGL